MKKYSVFLGSLLGVLMLANPAFAEGPSGEITVKVGTLGVGLEYVAPINENLTVGIGANGYTYSESIDESNVDYDADLELATVSLFANYHPWAGIFRVTGGVMYNGNQLSVTAQPTNGTYEINGQVYSTTDVGSIQGEIDFNSVAPYLGMGWGKSSSSTGWAIEANIGVLYQGTAEANLTTVCGPLLNSAQCSQLTNDVAAEQIQLQDELEGYDWYPVVSLGVSYMF